MIANDPVRGPVDGSQRTVAAGPPLAAPQSPEGALVPPTRPPVMRRAVVCFAVVGVLVALDLWSKAAVFAWFEDPAARADFVRTAHGHLRHALVGNWLAFMENLNYGAAFGQGDEWPWVLVVGRSVAVVLLSILVVRVPRGQGLYLTSLVLILAGALGNLYDNFFYEPRQPDPTKPFGPVRDFIDVYFGVWDWHFPTFNVADSCITVGAILLLASGFFAKAPAAKTPAVPSPDPPG